MNTPTLVALIATIVYIPLIIILVINRPWNRKQGFFFLFLIAAFLWSFTAIFFRSDFFMSHKLLIAKITLCVGIWMGVQYHYFLRSFHDPRGIKIPLAYVLLVSAITLAALGYMPQSMDVTAGGIHTSYGVGFFIVLFPTIFLCGRDMYLLMRRHRVSADPVERNQLVYLFLGMIFLAVIGMGNFTSWGADYPLPHLGNFANACFLIYAVARHKLLDVRVLFRRGLTSVIYGSFFVSMCLLWLLLFQKALGTEVSFVPTLVALLSTLVVFTIFGVQTRYAVSKRLEQLFQGQVIEPRHRLNGFIAKIHSVPTLEQFGSQLVSLLSQSIDCHRACLLLPQAGSGDFAVRFCYPPGEDNPIARLKVRHDSPVVAWLKREAQILPERNFSILPEFQGLWQEEKEDIQSAKVQMLVPLINRGELVAILVVGNKRNNQLYRVEEIDLMESVAGQVAASMEKEYLHEQLEQQDKELALVNRLSTIVTSSMNIKEIFEGFAQELKEVVDVDYAAVALIEGDRLHILALSGQIKSIRRAGDRIPLKGTTTEWVVERKKSLYEANLPQHSRFWTAAHYIKEGIRSIIHLPLVVRDRVIGSLIIAGCQPDAYNTGQIRLLERLALQIATPIENSQLYARAEERARIDELTGLFNRRHFEERLKEEIARHSRYSNAFSLLMLDLDNFKTYNDIYGHPAGDEILKQIGAIIRSSIRNADQAFRYGGDEFTVILPQTISEDAYVVAERVREQIASEMKAKEVVITCSIGLASYPSDGVMSGELVTATDTALYYAKRTGGNRTYLSAKVLSEPLTEAGANARGGGLSAVYALVSAVDAKDHYTYGHSRKVNTYAVALAEAIGLSPDEVSRVSTTALLHDIGKIGIPDKILSKKGKLTTEEWEAIKSHPKLGANIIGNVPSLVSCLPGILYHHERWDGTGYPEGLKGATIPLDAPHILREKFFMGKW